MFEPCSDKQFFDKLERGTREGALKWGWLRGDKNGYFCVPAQGVELEIDFFAMTVTLQTRQGEVKKIYDRERARTLYELVKATVDPYRNALFASNIYSGKSAPQEESA